MTEADQPKKGGSKVWYTIAILLSVLVLLLSAVGIVGVWYGQSTASRASVRLLQAAGAGTVAGRRVIARLDQVTGNMRTISTGLEDAATELSLSVSDSGVILTLLPVQKEQALLDQAAQINDQFNEIKDMLSSALDLYQSIDRLPFISLPKPKAQTVDKLGKAMNSIQTAAQTAHDAANQFRSGVAGKINTVSQAANQVTQRIDETRDNLNELDDRLQTLQGVLARAEQLIPLLFILGALLLTLFLVWVIYSEVVVIRMYVQSWRGGGKATPADVKESSATEQAPAAEENAPASVEPGPSTGQLPEAAGPNQDETKEPPA